MPNRPEILAIVRDPARLSALRKTGLLDTAPEEAFDRLTRLAARLAGAPVACCVLIDADRIFFKSVFGLPLDWPRERALVDSFCQLVLSLQEPLVIEDLTRHPTLSTHIAVTEVGVRAYAGVSLRTADGHVIGGFCAMDSQPRRWSEEQLGCLVELARSTMTEIELREAAAEAQRRADEAEALAEQNAVLRGRAEAALRAIEEMTAIASHDIRTPLTAVLCRAQMLHGAATHGAPASELAAGLEQLDAQIQRVIATANRLLDGARADAPRLVAPREPVDLAEVARESVRRFEALLARAGCEVTIAAPAPVVGCWDRTQVEQISSNLISNVVKYAPGKPVIVEVTATAHHGRLVVRDHGIGISPEEIPLVFARHGRTPSARDRADGSGLGLWIVKRAVEALGGAIAVESTRGAGATFIVDLPLDAPPGRSTRAAQPR